MSYKKLEKITLDKIFSTYLSLLIEKEIQKGILPSEDRMGSVSFIKEEVQKLPAQYKETIKYITKFDESYKILKGQVEK